MACLRLVNKVAVVTGSTAGIGFAIGKRLAEEGATVVLSSRNEKNVTKAVDLCKSEGLNVDGIVCNVADAQDRSNLKNHVIDKFGKLDVLVSNVGTNPTFGPTISCKEEIWSKIFYNNVTCSALLASEFTPLLTATNNGNIVFVSSCLGFCPAPFIGPYAASKAALISLTKVLSMELTSAKIRVNCIAPGFIETDFSSAITENKEMLSRTLKMIPMKRIGRAEECSGAVAFLVSDDASYMTGETISMDGGMPVRV